MGRWSVKCKTCAAGMSTTFHFPTIPAKTEFFETNCIWASFFALTLPLLLVIGYLPNALESAHKTLHGFRVDGARRLNPRGDEDGILLPNFDRALRELKARTTCLANLEPPLYRNEKPRVSLSVFWRRILWGKRTVQIHYWRVLKLSCLIALVFAYLFVGKDVA